MTTNDVDRLAVWAVRYALGRSTYAVSDVVEVLIRRRGQLQVKTALVIARDIDEAEHGHEPFTRDRSRPTVYPATRRPAKRPRRPGVRGGVPA